MRRICRGQALSSRRLSDGFLRDCGRAEGARVESKQTEEGRARHVSDGTIETLLYDPEPHPLFATRNRPTLLLELAEEFRGDQHSSDFLNAAQFLFAKRTYMQVASIRRKVGMKRGNGMSNSP